MPGEQYKDIVSGKTGYCFKLEQLNAGGSIEQHREHLKNSALDILKDLKKIGNIAEITIGKSHIKKRDKIKTFDKNNVNTWIVNPVSSRWKHYRDDCGYDGLIVMTVIDKDIVPNSENIAEKFQKNSRQQWYALALESSLIQQFIFDPTCAEYGKNLGNNGFNPGNLAEYTIASVIYLAFKFEKTAGHKAVESGATVQNLEPQMEKAGKNVKARGEELLTQLNEVEDHIFSSYSYGTGLESHMRTLELGKDEAYICLKCGRSYSSKSVLDDHVYAHEVEEAETARNETVRIETARAEAMKAEAVRAEATRVEAMRAEAVRAEAARVEATRAEAARVEAMRAEAARAEAMMANTARAEAIRHEAVRTESARAETVRAEAARAEAAGIQIAQNEATRAALFFAPQSMKTYICTICGMNCSTGAGLASHQRAHERRSENQMGTGMQSPQPPAILTYPCKICGRICWSGAGLASHMHIHEPGERTYTCNICGRICRSGAGLASHMRAHNK